MMYGAAGTDLRAPSRARKTLRSQAQIILRTSIEISVRTIDISTIGMSVISMSGLDTGTSCTVVFQIPLDGALRTVSAAATVLYSTGNSSDGFRLGIRFSDDDGQRADLIAGLR